MTIVTQRTDGFIRSAGIQGPQGITGPTGPVGSLEDLIVPTSSIIGRKTAGTGATEVLSVADTKTVLSLSNVDNTSDLNKPLSTIQSEMFDVVIGNGVESGCVISINTDTTKIDISSGLYHIYSIPDQAFAGLTGVVLTYLLTNLVTYLALDEDGILVQQTTPFTPTQRRTHVLLGAAIHSNLTIVNAVNNLPDVAVYGLSQYNDLLDSLNVFNVTGNVFGANGANLYLNKSIGQIFKRGANFASALSAPHNKDLIALTAPSTIRYRLSNGTEYTNTQSVSLYYESAPGVRTAASSTKWTIQRIALFSSNLVRIQYGPVEYTASALALQALHTEVVTLESNIKENGLIRAYLIVKGNCDDLTDTSKALFVEADRFGAIGGGAASGTTTLQQAYTNSETPEITTNSTLGALTLKRGSAADTDSVFEIQNNAGTITHKVLGDGTIIFPKTSGIGFKLDTTSPTYPWRDIIGEVKPDPAGANSPTLNTFMGGSIRRFSFIAADKCDCEFHIPHDYAPGTDVYVHYHWSHNGTAISGNIVTTFVHTYAKGHNQAIFAAEKTVTSTYATTNIATTPRYQHRIEEVQLSSNGGSASLLDSSLIEVDGIIGINFTMTTIPTITGGAPNAPFVIFIDLHYQSTGTGTKQKSPPFWT